VIWRANHSAVGVPRNGEPQEVPSSVANDDECKQAVKYHRWDNAQINCGNCICIVAHDEAAA
jgi:hypothetical protein